jgi:hypothetical protein
MLPSVSPLHMRALTPVLNMVAIDLMLKIETFIGKLDVGVGGLTNAQKAHREFLLDALRPIVYFQFSVRVAPNLGCGIVGGNGRCRTDLVPSS